MLAVTHLAGFAAGGPITNALWRLLFVGMPWTDAYIIVRAVHLYTTPDLTGAIINASAAVVDASSVYDGSTTPDRVLDENPSTWWRSGVGGVPDAWLSFRLATPTLVRSLYLHVLSNGAPTGAAVYCTPTVLVQRFGAGWETVATLNIATNATETSHANLA